MDINRLKEFSEIGNLDKFKSGSTIVFSCGINVYGWYTRNKNEILNSDDPYSVKIKQDLEKYRKIQYDRRTQDKEKTFCFNRSIEKLYQEFIDIKDLNKFNYDSDIKFKSGMPTGKWFYENSKHILFSKTPSCIKITQQYNKKKKIDEIKKRYINQKRKLEFIECANIQKYDKYNSPLFKDGTPMSAWFYTEFPTLKKSKRNVDILIKNGYYDYLLIYDLRQEFLEAPSEEKFDPFGIARFTTGAVMCLWWECYRDEILNSNNPIDRKIAGQYLEYTTGGKKEVLIKK